VKRLALFCLVLSLSLSVAGCTAHPENGQNLPLSSPENTDTTAVIPAQTSLPNPASAGETEDSLDADVCPLRLTLPTLRDLVARYGETLTWDDFAPYDKEELGSDPYCFRYPIDWDYCLEIAGDSLESEPAYIRIVSEYDGENYVDVRYADLDAFLDTSPQTSQFSYEEVLAAYPAEEPGVKSSGFQNTSSVALERIRDVRNRAENECTVEYDSVEISYDAQAAVWQVAFYTAGYAGGGQSVYLDGYGVTCLIVYGE
jgi:hypothetical protein